MTCANCGVQIQPGQMYCSNCGTPLNSINQPTTQQYGSSAQQSSVETIQKNMPYNTTANTPPYSTDTATKNVNWSTSLNQPVHNQPVPNRQNQAYQNGNNFHQQSAQFPQMSGYSMPAQQGYSNPYGINNSWQTPPNPTHFSTTAMRQQPAFAGHYPSGVVGQPPWAQPLMSPPMIPNLNYGQPPIPVEKWDPKKKVEIENTMAVQEKAPTVEVLTPTQCFVTILLGMIPIVGIFFCLVWLNSKNISKMKLNIVKGILLIQGILLAILIVLLVVWVTSLSTVASSVIV